MTAQASQRSDARAPNTDRVVDRIREFFSLRSRLEAARARTFAASDPGFREYALGLGALRNAVQLGTAGGETNTGLLLARSALRLLVWARAARTRGAAERLSWNEAWESFTSDPKRWTALESEIGAAAAIHVKRAIGEEGDAYVAGLSEDERDLVLVATTALAKHVVAPLEDAASAVQRTIWLARTRVAVGLALVLLPLAWTAVRLGASPNLAYHQHVVVSERDPSVDVDPKHLVDGDRTNLGFHTPPHAGISVTIDLGAVKPVRRVEVYNRADCCLERVVPLAVEVSADGKDYRPIARNDRIFDHWTVHLPSKTSARFVRLTHGSATNFHLSEVEIY